MIIRKIVVVVCLAVCWVNMAPVTVGQDAQPAKNSVSKVQHLVSIKFDPAHLPLDRVHADAIPGGETVLSWVLVDDLFDRAVNDVIPKDEQEKGRRYIQDARFLRWIDADTVKSDAGMVLGTLEVTFDRPVDPKIAERLWNAVNVALQNDLNNKSGVQRVRDRMRIRLQIRIERLSTQVRESEKQFLADYRKLAQLQRGLTTSSADLLARLSDAEKQEQRLEMDVLGAEARAEAIRERIEVVRKEIQKKATDDAVVGHLAEVVKLRKSNVGFVALSSGPTTRNDLIKAKEALALANVDLLRARADAARRAGADRLGKLGDELSDLVIAITGVKAQHQAITKQTGRLMAKILAARDTEREIDEFKSGTKVLKEHLDSLGRLLIELELEMDQVGNDELRGVTITVWDNRRP